MERTQNTAGATDVDDEMLWQDLPWCGDGVLVRIATHERVMRVPTAQPHNATEKQIEMWNTRYDKTVERRNTAIAVASSMEDTEELQLANKLLKAAVTGMLKSFNDIHSERYNGRILTTTDADLLLLAESVPSTSDAVEKFLGLVSYLEASNRNQGPLNRFYQLLAREMKISEKLQDLRAKDPDFVHTAMNKGRTFKLILAERVAERADKALDRRKKDIEHHLARDHKLTAAKQVKDAAMDDLMADWIHLPYVDLVHWVGWRCSQGINVQARGGAGRIQRAQRQWLKDCLEGFDKVHRCRIVKHLHAHFYGNGHPPTGNVGYKEHKKIKRTTREMLMGVHGCSRHVYMRGSPACTSVKQYDNDTDVWCMPYTYAEHEQIVQSQSKIYYLLACMRRKNIELYKQAQMKEL